MTAPSIAGARAGADADLNESAAGRPLCRAIDVEIGAPVRADVEGLPPLAVFHLEDGFYVIGDTCTHGEASLCDGFVEGDEIEAVGLCNAQVQALMDKHERPRNGAARLAIVECAHPCRTPRSRSESSPER